MHKHSLLILFLCLLCFGAFGQKKSKIYNKKGQLIADTSYHISKTQLRKFAAIEDTLVKQILSRIVYPEVEMEAGITGKAIFSFAISNADTLSDINVVEQIPGGRGLTREGARVLKRITFPKKPIVNTSKSTTYYVAVGWALDQTKKFEDGVIWKCSMRPPSWPPPATPIYPPIQKWMDSINGVTHGQWSSFLKRMYEDAKGSWWWGYKHGNDYSSTGSPDSNVLYVQRGLYAPGDIVSDGGGPISFTYYPKSKKITYWYNTIYLGGKVPIFFTHDEWYGSMNGEGGCFNAAIYSEHDTLYSGHKEAYVRSPIDGSKYFVFMDDLSGESHFIASCIIDKKLKTFKKGFHPEDGVLIKCRFLLGIYDKYRRLDVTSKDSTIYVFFSRDSIRNIKPGDTVLLNLSSPLIADKNNKRAIYYSVNQIYPFGVQQIEEITTFHSSWIQRMPIMAIKRPFLYRLLHGRDNYYSDPVFHYLKRNRLTYSLEANK